MVVEYLPSIHKMLGSSPRITKIKVGERKDIRRKKRNRGKGGGGTPS